MTTIRSAQRLEVDWTRCDGHGVCATLLPGVITRDDWGYPIIDAEAAATTGAAGLNRVVTACPALALRRAGSGRAEVGARPSGVRSAAGRE